MACETDCSKAVYFIDGDGAVKESLPDENGLHDQETEFWRDSQVSSSWMAVAYRIFSDLKGPEEAAIEVCDDAPVTPVASVRSRSRSSGRKTNKK